MWMKGDNSPDIAGVYGTKGLAAASNKPGSRRLSVIWTDKAGNLWLYQGQCGCFKFYTWAQQFYIDGQAVKIRRN